MMFLSCSSATGLGCGLGSAGPDGLVDGASDGCGSSPRSSNANRLDAPSSTPIDNVRQLRLNINTSLGPWAESTKWPGRFRPRHLLVKIPGSQFRIQTFLPHG